MAVPKKRTSRSTQGQRRSHLALMAPQLVSAAGSLVPRRLKKAAELGLIKLDRKKA